MRQYIVIAIISVLFSSNCEASVNRTVKEGNRLYSEEKYEEALEKYNEILQEESETDIINFNAGAVFYKNKDYDNATMQFRKALLGKNESLKQKAYYNLGNSLYNQGLNVEEEDASNAIKLLEESISEYEKALKLDAQDEQVQNNHKYVTKELERIKKKLEQQKQEQQQEQDQKNKNDEDKKDNKENKSQSRSKDNKKDDSTSKQDQGEENKKDQQQSGQKDQKDDQSDKEGQSAKDKEDENQEGQSQSGSMSESKEKSPNNEENAKGMTDEEYKNFLDNYQQNEEPKGILNLQPRRTRIREVEKDW